MRADVITKELRDSGGIDLTKKQFALAHFLLSSNLCNKKNEGVLLSFVNIIARNPLNGNQDSFAEKLSPEIVKYKEDISTLDVEQVLLALFELDYLSCTYYFNDSINDYYELNNEDINYPELDEALVELAKSKLASEKYLDEDTLLDSGNVDYQRERGKMLNPHTGEIGEDPLLCLFKQYAWTGKLGFDEYYVIPSVDDELQAYSDLLPDSLKVQFAALAKEKAIKRMDD